MNKSQMDARLLKLFLLATTSTLGVAAADEKEQSHYKDAGDAFVEAFKGLSDSNRSAQDAPSAERFDQITDRFAAFSNEVDEAIQGNPESGQPFAWENSTEFGIATAFEATTGEFFKSVSLYQSLFSQLQSDAVQLDALIYEARVAREGQETADTAASIVQLIGAGAQIGHAGYKFITSVDELAEATATGARAADDAVSATSGAASSADTVADAGGAITLPLSGADDTLVDGFGVITLPVRPNPASLVDEGAETVVGATGLVDEGAETVVGATGLVDEGAETVVGGANAANRGVSSATVAPPNLPTAPVRLDEAIEPGVLRAAEEAGVDAQAILNQAYGGQRGWSGAADDAAEQAILVAIMVKQGGHRLAPGVEAAARNALLKVQIALNNGDEAVDIASELSVLREVADEFASADDFLAWMSRAFDDAFDGTGIDLMFNSEQLGMLSVLMQLGGDMGAIRQAVGPVKIATTGATATRSGFLVEIKNKIAVAGKGITAGGNVASALELGDRAINGNPSTAPSVATAGDSEQTSEAADPNVGLYASVFGATPNIFSLAGGFNGILDAAAGPARINRRAEGYENENIGYAVAAGREAVEFLTGPFATASDWGYSDQITDVFGQFLATYSGEFTMLGNYTQTARRSLDNLQTVIDRAEVDDANSLFGGRGEADLEQMLTDLDNAYNSASKEWQDANKARYTAMRKQILKAKEDLNKFTTTLVNLDAELTNLTTYVDTAFEAGNGANKTGSATFDPIVFVRLTSAASALGVFRDALTLQSDGKPPARVVEASGQSKSPDTALVDYVDPSWFGSTGRWSEYWTVDDCHVYEGIDYGPCGPTPEPDDTPEEDPSTFGEPRLYLGYGAFSATGFGEISAGTLVPGIDGAERPLVTTRLEDWDGWQLGGSIGGPEIFGYPTRYRFEAGYYESDSSRLGSDPEGPPYGVALTFNEEFVFPSGSSTGLFLGDAFQLDGLVKATGELAYLKGGVEKLKWGDGDTHVTSGANLFYRQFETDLRGDVSALFGGVPFGGIGQQNIVETETKQIGAYFDVNAGQRILNRNGWQPGLSIGLSGSLEIMNSDISGDFWQVTTCDPGTCGADLSNVEFNQAFDKSKIDIGGSIGIGLSADFTDKLDLSIGYQYGVIPGGAAFSIPFSPNGQPGVWRDTDHNYDGVFARLVRAF